MINKGKKIKQGEDARNSLVKGFQYVNDAVKTSLGPMGRNTIMRANMLVTKSTKDGITIMKSINAYDEPTQFGIDLLREASLKTVMEAGDGTTSTSLLATSITEDGVKGLNEAKSTLSAVSIKEGINKATIAAINRIRSISQEVNKQGLDSVATIAANNDTVTGRLISDLIWEVGSRGDILIERNNSDSTFSKLESGTKYNVGYCSPLLINNEQLRDSQLSNVYLLISAEPIVRGEQYSNIMESLIKFDETASLVVIAPEILGSMRTFLEQNNNTEGLMRGKLSGVHAIGQGEYQTAVLDDLALLTGATIIGNSKGVKPDTCDYTVLGRAEKMIITKDTTLIVSPKTIDSEKLESRKVYLEEQISKSHTSEKEEFSQRLAYLNGKTGVIYIGGNSDVEANEKKDRIDDSIASAKAALEEGIVPGGGVTYIFASKFDIKGDNESEDFGIELVRDALKKPFYQVLDNAMFNHYTPTQSEGYNIKTGEKGNLIELGVVDATLVLISSLKNATSVAATVLLTEILAYGDDA